MLTKGLRVVFCGSAAGNVSARRAAYYAHPQNRFWPTLFEVGLTPRQMAPAEYPSMPAYGLGLTDLCKTASGGDAELPADADDPSALDMKIRRYAPAILAFVGKRPAQVFSRRLLDRRAVEYGWQPASIGKTRLFVLPSPSPAAIRYWDIAWWRMLAEAARRPADGTGRTGAE